LLDRQADIEAKSRKGFSPLHAAAFKGQAKAIDLLLTSGGDANHAGNDGRTPLHLAVKMGQIQPIKLLIAAGADIGREDKLGNTPLAFASEALLNTMGNSMGIQVGGYSQWGYRCVGIANGDTGVWI
jgi:ankyrin repeat protein